MMLKINTVPENPTSKPELPESSEQKEDPGPPPAQKKQGFWSNIQIALGLKKADSTKLGKTLGDFIDISDHANEDDRITSHERALLTNILHLRDIRVENIMVPRAEIIALDIEASYQELLEILAEKQVSRIPIFEDNLDNILGSIHIKDLLLPLSEKNGIDIKSHLTDIFFVSPAMPVLDLILAMRQNRRHMALVVDEYGGIDGLVTIGDVVESIVGEIEDEHDIDDVIMQTQEDSSIIADARIYIEDFENAFGKILTPTEREEAETLGGLVFSLAGRIPARGEVLTHKSGMVFEILEADPRRIHRIRIRDIPAQTV